MKPSKAPEAPKHPGEYLLAALADRKLTALEFAKMHGLDPVQVDAIIAGTKDVDALWAQELASALETTPAQWVEVQAAHDASKAPVV